MRQMDRYLPLRIRIICQIIIGTFRYYATNAELPCYAQGQRANNGPWAQVSQMVAMVPNRLLRPIVTVDERAIWCPFVGTLES